MRSVIACRCTSAAIRASQGDLLMTRNRFVTGLVAAVTALGGMLLLAPPAHADQTNACTISQWPNIAGGQSSLKVACAESTATATEGAAGQQLRLEDYPQAAWHFGAARDVTTTAATAAGSKVLTSSSG